MTSFDFPPTFWLGMCLIVVSILALMLVDFWWRWLSNRTWKFTTSESPPDWWESYFAEGRMWRSQNPQTEGTFYKVDFGKERTFNGIQFYHGISNETPQRWRMWFLDKTNGYIFPSRHKHPYIETGDQETKQGTVAIIVELDQPISAQYVKVDVIDPFMKSGEAHHWRIEAIFLKVRILGLRRHTIGKFYLDKL